MDQRIVFKNQDGTVGVIIPAPDWFTPDEEGNVKTIEQLAEKDVPQGLPWRVVNVSALPTSRNWRNAWTDDQPTETVDVDLAKARQVHKSLMYAKAGERVSAIDMPNVLVEIAALPVDDAASLQELFNMWPARIEKRNGQREYAMHGGE